MNTETETDLPELIIIQDRMTGEPALKPWSKKVYTNHCNQALDLAKAWGTSQHFATMSPQDIAKKATDTVQALFEQFEVKGWCQTSPTYQEAVTTIKLATPKQPQISNRL